MKTVEDARPGLLAGWFQVNEVSQLMAHLSDVESIDKDDLVLKHIQGRGLEKVIETKSHPALV